MSHNTKEGIAAQLGSYEAFYAVMQLRNERGSYKSDGTDGEERGKLDEFTVLGRYYTDQYGQIQRLNRELFTDTDRAAMPSVMTDAEFSAFFNTNVLPRIKASSYSILEGVSGLWPKVLPSPHVFCSHCQKGWDLEHCHDINSDGDLEEYDLSEFVGKTLGEVKANFAARTDMERYFCEGLMVYHFIPNDEVEDIESQYVLFDSEEAAMQYVIQEGDSMSIFQCRFYHGECFRQLSLECVVAQEKDALEAIKQMLLEIGFEEVNITKGPLPEHLLKWIALDLDEGESVDQYAKELMYYRVETKQGSFGIGHAAHGLIDFYGSGVTLADFQPEIAVLAPPEFPPIIGLTGPDQLVRLFELMTKK